MSLTRECAEITRIPYVINTYRNEAMVVLKKNVIAKKLEKYKKNKDKDIIL